MIGDDSLVWLENPPHTEDVLSRDESAHEEPGYEDTAAPSEVDYTLEEVEIDWPVDAAIEEESLDKEGSMFSQETTSHDLIGPGEYTVRQGDCIQSIAYRAGFPPATLWDHPSNATLKKKRHEPSVLMPGDLVVVPQLEIKECSCPTDKSHVFKRKGTPAEIRIRLLDGQEPRRNVDYLLEIEGTWIRGTTDDDGYLDEKIAPDAWKGRLIVNPGPRQEEIPLVVGGLDPLDEVRGVQGRLANLGYDCLPTGELDEQTRSALAAFQRDREIKETSDLDQATRDALRSFHET